VESALAPPAGYAWFKPARKRGIRSRVACPDEDDVWVYSRWYPCQSGFAQIARRGLREFAIRCGFEGAGLTDIESAVGEALANAIEHGHHPEKGFTVRANCLPDRLLIEVRDGGPGCEEDLRDRNRSKMAPRGYGIRIMTTVMDAVEFSERGTCVRLTKYLDQSQRR
jgi:anti-sigma regulatory factor (Ser/Thr protein kinase)